jgi:hypothetical protein
MDRMGGVGQIGRPMGLDRTEGTGALGEHRLEIGGNDRAEPRGTSIGDKIKSFFQKISDKFSAWKTERQEAKSERRMDRAAQGFAQGLGNGRASMGSFQSLVGEATRRHGAEQGMGIAVGKLMDAIGRLPATGQETAMGHLRTFSDEGSVGQTLTNSFNEVMDRNDIIADRLMESHLPSRHDPSQSGQMREAFASTVRAFGDGLGLVFERQSQVDNPVNALLNGALDGPLFDKLDSLFAAKLGDENTKFMSAVNDWKDVMRVAGPVRAREGFEQLMDYFVRNGAQMQIDVRSEDMEQLRAIARGDAPLTAQAFDNAAQWVGNSVAMDVNTLAEFREDPAVLAYVRTGRMDD